MAIPSPTLTNDTTSTPTNEENDWMDVVHSRRVDCDTNVAYKTNMALTELPPDCPHLYYKHFLDKGLVVSLKPDETYKIRVAAVNSLGVGPWSEVASYGPANAGMLGAPTNVKITRTVEGGTLLSWDPPSISTSLQTGKTLEFCVYLEVEKGTMSPLSDFENIYRGEARSCLVSRELLMTAKFDRKDERTCIIFRISAILEDLETTMQVRWLQDGKGEAKEHPISLSQ